jgi:hypothetical protein
MQNYPRKKSFRSVVLRDVETPHFPDNRPADDGEVSLTRRPPFTRWKIPY